MAHPKDGDNDIVVKNIYASICGTDYELKIPTNLKYEFRLVGIFSVDFAYTSDYNKIRF